MYSIMLMTLQKLCKSCRASCYFFCIILLQMSERLNPYSDTCLVLRCRVVHRARSLCVARYARSLSLQVRHSADEQIAKAKLLVPGDLSV